MRVSSTVISIAAFVAGSAIINSIAIADDSKETVVAGITASMNAPMVATVDAVQTKDGFVKNLVHSVLATLHDGNRPFIEKQAALKQAFTNVVDMDWIARFVIGKTWSTATEAQKAQYIELYRTYLTNTYVSNFDEDSEGKLRDIKIISMNDEDEDTFRVHSEMDLADSDPVKVDYLVRGTNGQYKIIDIAIEGVSLLATHRSEFSELASSGGIDNVIGKLQQMVGNNKTTLAQSAKAPAAL